MIVFNFMFASKHVAMRYGVSPYAIVERRIVTSFIRCTKFGVSTNSSADDIVDHENTQTDVDIIDKKRNKSRMSDIYHKRYIKKEMPPMINDWDYKPRYLKRNYATYGKSSGLNPGLMWPTKEEFQEMVEFEREFETPVQVMIRNIEEAKLLEIEARRKREEDVLAKVGKLHQWIKEFKQKDAKKQAAAAAEREKRERLLEEAREYFGYDIDQHDVKFKEFLENKELAEKKAKKAARKKARQEKALASLLSYSGIPGQSTTITEQNVSDKAAAPDADTTKTGT